ncbi:hypothetical protein PMAYCL1PPCAC_23042, partial [Pristionchus mayeri]
ACLNCAANLITVTTAMLGSQPMDGDTTDTTGACAVRTFTCLGVLPANPTIEVNNGASEVEDVTDGAADGSTTLALTCNAAGTAWESNGVAVTNVECYIPCRNCADNLIAITMTGPNPIFTNVVDRMAPCATWTFACSGNMANIEINGGQGVFVDADDGVVDGIVTFPVTCNGDGTAWEAFGVPITAVNCATV